MASTLGITAVYASAFLSVGAPRAMVPVMIVSIATMMIALMALGAARADTVGALAWPLALAWIVVVAGFLAALLLPAETSANAHLLLGMPRRAAIILYGVGMVPLLAMPVAYALTFESTTLSESDLHRLREEAASILDRE
jgi:hypothetical protein